jgi:hypothetical protein
MQQWKEALEQAAQSQRCEAKTRQGSTCQSPAMRNGRCRMHGGKSTGAPCGVKHGRYKHGRFTKERLAQRAFLAGLMREAGELVGKVEELV